MYDSYVAAWRKRASKRAEQDKQRVAMAWQEAKRLAKLLYTEFSAEKVWLFGSLALQAHGLKRFHAQSDIDLAVRGVSADRFYAAQGRLLMESTFSVDLVDIDNAPPALRNRVLEEGVILDSE